MLRIVSGTFGSTLRNQIISDVLLTIDNYKNQGIARQQIIIVPEHCSHEAERLLCEKGGDGISLNAEILTFRRLSNRIFGEVGGLADKVLDAGGRILAMKSALDIAGPALKIYGNASKKTSFISNLVELISEFKEEIISSDELSEMSMNETGRLSDKLFDISYIYSAYSKKIQDSAYDTEDINKMTSEKISQSEFIRNADIYFDGFSGFTPQQLMIIKEMLKAKISVTISMMYNENCKKYQSEIFYKEERTIRKLINVAKSAKSIVKIDNAQNDCIDKKSPQMFISENLFNYASKEYPNKSNFVKIHKAQDIFSECEFVAASIKKLVREEHIRYKYITIAARQLDKYSGILSSVFKYYGIPIFISEPQNILKRPIFSYILSALEAVEEFKTYSIMKALKSGFSNISPDQADKLEAYTSLWRISPSKWVKGNSFNQNPDGYSEKVSPDSQATLEELNQIKDTAMIPFLKLKSEMEQAKTGEDFVRALYNFIISTELTQKIENRTTELINQGELRLSEEYVQLWNILISAMEQFFAMSGKDEMTPKSFRELLALVLSEYDVDTIPVSIDSVKAVGMERIGYISEKYLFVIGASDTEIPMAHKMNGILTAGDREKLSECGIDMSKTSLELSLCENGIIYKTLTSAEKMLVCSYCATSADGQESRPSFVLSHIKQMFPLSQQTTNNLDIRAEAPATLYEKACFYIENGLQDEFDNLCQQVQSEQQEFMRLKEITSLCKDGRTKAIPQQLIQQLYGDNLNLSPSQIESFFTCNFYYFMKYGLRAKKNRTSAFEASETGSFVHYILEKSIRELDRLKSKNKEDISAIVKKYTNQYINDVIGGFDDKTKRFKYLLMRLSKGAEFIASDVANELNNSLFNPLDFELVFSEKYGVKPYAITTPYGNVYVGGKADRVDGYLKDDKLYIRVSDYKTGQKRFNLSDVNDGLNLQMLIYLFAVCKNGLDYYKQKPQLSNANISGIVPAGVLYTHAKEPVIAVPADVTDEEYEQIMRKEFKRCGIIAGDDEIIQAMEKDITSGGTYLPIAYNKTGELSMSKSSVCSYEDFDNISKYIDKTIGNMTKDIKCGKIIANPYQESQTENACNYCDYHSACMFDQTLSLDKMRYLSNLDKELFLKQLQEDNQAKKEENDSEQQMDE